MVKVITYGTYDLLHYGHIKLLERAKALGDYLIVGVTADDFDKTRGKINVQQSLMERVEAVRATGIADEIIVEEYEGQKIDDIIKYDVDIFTVGSDWVGKFDYLNEYCKVVYLPRTEGVSSSEIRSKSAEIRFGLVGNSRFINKVYKEALYVNGINIVAIYTDKPEVLEMSKDIAIYSGNYDQFLDAVDAIYIRSIPSKHYLDSRRALEHGKHVLCEAPVSCKESEYQDLKKIASDNHLVLMDALKTAYGTAYSRLVLMIKSGKIGDVVSIDATCTSLKNHNGIERTNWNVLYEWGPTVILPIFDILGTEFKKINYVIKKDINDEPIFAKLDFVYRNAVANVKISDEIKAEGDLIISGTKGYVYVPSPWWNMDYFEIRYEDQSENKRYFYQLDGEGIRNELVIFARSIRSGKNYSKINDNLSLSIVDLMDRCMNDEEAIVID